MSMLASAWLSVAIRLVMKVSLQATTQTPWSAEKSEECWGAATMTNASTSVIMPSSRCCGWVDLDTSLKRILLIGNQIWGPSFTGPCILASPVDLSCFGEIVQRRVFAFQYFEAFERQKVFSDSDMQSDLKACPEDLLDTWGPGDFIMPKNDSENLHAISIGGGLIISTSTENHQLPILHWSRASEGNTISSSTFPRNEKMFIGSRVSINQACRVTPQEQVQMAIPWLKELVTFQATEKCLKGS
jgi:hypothetical protein